MFNVVLYNEAQNLRWDEFIDIKSINGTFLQKRKFLNYHPEGRFEDCSLMIYKSNELVALIPACTMYEEKAKVFFSHKGTTFGGIIFSDCVCNVSDMNEIMNVFEAYIKENGYKKVVLKQTAPLFQKEESEIVDYFLYQKGFNQYAELNFYIDLPHNSDFLSGFSSGKRRDYRYAQKKGLEFARIDNAEGIKDFYRILLLTLNKLNLHPVHSLDELIDLKFIRFSENIRFYGVYYDKKLIAGSMVFVFDNNVFHTQYLASDPEYLNLFSMDYLIGNLIRVADEDKMKSFTFGICTEDNGKYLNMGLSRFKEGFGSKYSINRTYTKNY